jgi:hypothetical protein
MPPTSLAGVYASGVVSGPGEKISDTELSTDSSEGLLSACQSDPVGEGAGLRICAKEAKEGMFLRRDGGDGAA